MAVITEHERAQIDEANASGKTPVVFVHGLRKNDGITEIQKIPGRGHSLTIDGGWREVADLSLAFVQRFVDARAGSEMATATRA